MSNAVSNIRAVIDIGTNSVKLLVAETGEGSVRPLHEASEQTRLGRGLYETGRLSAQSLRVTARVLERYATDANNLESRSIRVVATSAARDAKNGDELADVVKQSTGSGLEIISGDQEASWVYRGVSSQSGMSGQPLLVSDVGGGSTELIIGDQGECRFAHSFQLGTVRQLEDMTHSDPPSHAELNTTLDRLGNRIREEIVPRLREPLTSYNPAIDSIVGVGGTTTFLARINHATDEFNRKQIETTRFETADLKTLTEKLWNLSLDQRRNLPGLPPNRADVILFGAAIYLALLTELNLKTLLVSTRGVRFGALLDS